MIHLPLRHPKHSRPCCPPAV